MGHYTIYYTGHYNTLLQQFIIRVNARVITTLYCNTLLHESLHNYYTIYYDTYYTSYYTIYYTSHCFYLNNNSMIDMDSSTYFNK